MGKFGSEVHTAGNVDKFRSFSFILLQYFLIYVLQFSTVQVRYLLSKGLSG